VEEILIGFTSKSVLIFIPDPASTVGAGKTGLVAANLTASYTRMETDNDAVVTDVTSSLNDLAALTSSFNAWGLKEVSSTLAPGLYRLDIADACFATGAWEVVVYVCITSGLAAATPKKFKLVNLDMYSSAAQRLNASGKTICLVTVTSGSTTTVINTSSIDPSEADVNQFAGRVLLFLSDTTSAELRGQGARIESTDGSGELTLTDALSQAPASGDVAVIV
jgi:hypothetical protein